MMMSFAKLNRLDICIFTKWKSLDFGHRAFMSMLILTHISQTDTFKDGQAKKAAEKMMRKYRQSFRPLVRMLKSEPRRTDSELPSIGEEADNEDQPNNSNFVMG